MADLIPFSFLNFLQKTCTRMIWTAFLSLIAFLLFIDLYVLGHNTGDVPDIKTSIKQSLVWVALGLLFSGVIFYVYSNHLLDTPVATSGKEASLQYLTGYIIELALSVDNLFVIALIMSYFKVPDRYQYKILFWGILGVVILRGLMIGVGYSLISLFSWVNYVFAAILLFSAYKMATASDEDDPDFENNGAIKILSRFFSITNKYENGNFFTIENGKKAATTLFVTLLVVETTDVLFAFDSVPAVFSVTKDPFLVFSSNIFAILGLRAMYFVLAASLQKFEYLDKALIIILVFIGVKMLIEHWYTIPVGVSLLIVVGLLVGGVVASLLKKKE